MKKKQGLGKGLDALFSNSNISLNKVIDNSLNTVTIKDYNDKIVQIDCQQIVKNPYQPRLIFNQEELEELADSIKTNGLIQPIIVRPIYNETNILDHYELIAGERRYLATKLAGFNTINAIIRNFTDLESMTIALIENLQRKDLNVLEEAKSYSRLINTFNVTHDVVAQMLGKSRSHISNILRLLNLTDEVQQLLLENKISMGHARAILSLPIEMQTKIATEIIENNYTTKVTEQLVQDLLQDTLNTPQDNKDFQHNIDDKIAKSQNVDPNILHLQNNIEEKLCMKVGIKHKKTGDGKLVIEYASLDSLDNFLRIIGINIV